VHSSNTETGLSAGSSGGAKCIQIFTAAVLQMIQGCAELPSQDASTTDIVGAFGPPVKAADYFWAQCLDRLPMARTHKAETDHDFTALLQGVVNDLLVASALPEWPAAGTLLLRLAATINSQRGLQHTDPIVRQVCVDLLGRLLATVHTSEAAARDDVEWLEGVACDNGFEDATQAAQELLLKYLSDRHHASSTSASISRRFWLVRALSESAAAAMHGRTDEESNEEDKEQVQAALLESRKKLDELDAMVYDTGVDASDAARLMQQSLGAAFGRAAPAMLSWLLEMLDSRAQAPTTRAKAVKALADLAAADPAVLGMSAVQAAVERSLGDDSISVREASLNLLGRHMSGDPELALSLLDTVIKAVDDPGASVRKCAIKILKESAIAVPGFPRATDACCALLLRASDSEESVQNAVAKVFHSLWFSPQVESADGSTIFKRSLEERAAQLADVAAAAYDAGGASIHLPMDTQTPLVGVLRAALGWEARGDLHLEWKAGRQIAEALLESILSQQHLRRGENGGDEDDEDEDAIRPALLALHALAITDADFCLPEKNPQKFLRALAPYLKAAPDSQYTTEVERRNAAERLLCVLSVVESVLSQLDHLNDNLGALADVPGDLVSLINQHRYTQVVAAACKCIAALAHRSTAAAARLVQVAHVYYKWLQSPGEHSQANLPRFLFILGQLCRHGSQIIDRAAMQTPGTVSVPACLVTFGQYWRYNGPAALKEQVKRCALEATGQLAIARPLTMVQSNSDARRMLDAALKRDASSGFKMAALSSLTELLQADAESLERRQKVQLATTPGTTTVGAAVNGSSGKKRGAAAGSAGSCSAKKRKGLAGSRRRKKASFTADEDSDEDEDFGVPRSATIVATENGEGDSLSQSSAVLQQHWDAVLVLATDSGAASAVGVSPAVAARIAADGIAIRRRVIALMDVVLRDGLVGPWTAVPALVALSSDGIPDVANRALRLLCELAEKHPQYVDAGRLTAGLEQAYKLHCGPEPSLLNSSSAVTRRITDAIAPTAALSALGVLYTRLIWSSRPRRNDFLRALLRQYRVVLGSGVAAGRADIDGAPLRLLAFIAAVAGALPLRRAEEACIIIQEAAGICASHADAVLVELHSLLGEEDEDGAGSSTPVPNASAFAAPCRAAAALCMLYRLRARMERAYSISPERAAAFAAAGKRKTNEEGVAVSADPSAPPLHLGDLDLGAVVDAKTARHLMVELEASHGGVGEEDIEEAE
jgi:cohesin loading factor subunit SCC2